jgi:HK97 family phage major capsid protein
MTAIIEAGMRDEFQSEIFKEKLSGTGAGELEGILNSPAIIAVTRTTGSTLKGEDIINVRSRAYRYGRSIWLANHNALGALELAHRAGTNSDTFYFKAGTVIPGVGDNPSLDVPDTLMGRPIIFNEYVPALGSLGDLILWDPTEYLFGVGVAPGATGQAESIHVRFVNHERTFKFWQMNDGRCWWRAPLQPVLGDTLSPIVTVAA